MTVVPHIRMTAYGDLPGGEIFNFGLSLANPDSDDGGLGNGLWAGELVPGATVWDDLRDDLITFWADAGVSGRAKLRGVKFASIGADGKYRDSPHERVIGGATGLSGGLSTATHANQVSLAVTTHSVGDLGRVKGRFYLPVPGHALDTNGRIDTTLRDNLENNVKTFINNLNNEPGIDLLNMQVVVASSGRRNPDGSVKFPPKNWVVNAVSVGLVPDTQRRRRNKLSEMRGTPTSL